MALRQVAPAKLRLDRSTLSDHGVLRLDELLRRLLRRQALRRRTEHFELRSGERLSFQPPREEHYAAVRSSRRKRACIRSCDASDWLHP